MIRLNLLLLAVAIVCALSIITSQHKVRTQFAALQNEREHEQQLDREWRELQLESQTLSTGKRIEQKATKELGMAIPDAKKVVIVVLGSGSGNDPAKPLESVR